MRQVRGTGHRWQVWFAGNGRTPGEEPYSLHYYRVNLDGTGLVDLTPAPGNHTVVFSDDHAHHVDHWSQVDRARWSSCAGVRTSHS